MGSCHRDRPSSTVVLQVFRDSERDAGGVGGSKWQVQRDVIIEQPLFNENKIIKLK